MKRTAILLVMLILVLGLASCEREGKEGREGSNDFIKITLVNQSNKTVDLLFPNESISQNTKVAAGQSRTERRMLEHVWSVKFRAASNGNTIATKTCQYREHQTSFQVSVIFDGSKLSCGQGW